MSEDLRRALRDPGFTPPRRAFGEMFALLAHPELAEKAERALLSAGLPAAAYAAENLDAQTPSTAPALVRLIGRAARGREAPAELLEALSRALHSADAETRREAAMALGKSGRSDAEAPLLACLEGADVKLQRSVIEALGKVGGERALARLRSFAAPAGLQQVWKRALLMLERTLQPSDATNDGEPIVIDRALPRALSIALQCRSGLARYLAEEAATLGAELVDPGEVRLVHGGALEPLLQLRLASTVAIAWPLPGGANPDNVLSALLDPELVAAMQAWSLGSLRFRLEWRGGQRRADTWRVAQGLREAGSPLLNAPAQAPWLIEVEPERLRIAPVGAPDLRFGYRVRDVPAASHPTLAAALARVAGVDANDVVWDPFAGSGVELVERARLGPVRELHGTDLDARAIAAARENAASAGLAGLSLLQADARHHRVPGLSLVLTNPPMGRRVLRARGLSGVLCQVVRNVASQLVPGGRMVWLSAFPDATARAAADAGLSVERLGAVDLGGFDAELQRFRRPASPTA